MQKEQMNFMNVMLKKIENKQKKKKRTHNKELCLKPNKISIIFPSFVLETNFSLARRK